MFSVVRWGDWDFMLPPAMKGFRRHLLSVPAGGNVNSPVAAVLRFRSRNEKVHDRLPPVRHPSRAVMEEATHHIRGRTASGNSSGGETISRPGLRSSEPSGFRGDAGVYKFHAADHSVNASVVPLRGFGVAAGFCMLQLRVQERAAAPTLSATHPDSVAESLLNMGNVVVRRQDTSPRTRPGGTATCSLSPAAKHP